MNQKQMGSDEISLLIWTILQPAVAGGMVEKEAEEIYNKIMGNISNLGELETGKTGFQELLGEILYKLVPEFQKKIFH
jgi:hypothetical protein